MLTKGSEIVYQEGMFRAPFPLIFAVILYFPLQFARVLNKS